MKHKFSKIFLMASALVLAACTPKEKDEPKPSPSGELTPTVLPSVTPTEEPSTTTPVVTPTESVEPTPSETPTPSEVIINVSNVSLDNELIELVVEDTFVLKATVLPEDATNKNVFWNSSDSSVASVDNGTVKALKEGQATITVTTEDGGLTDTCIVKVSPKVIHVTGVSLDKTTLSLEEGQSSTLVATVSPSDATDKSVTWRSSDESVASVKDGTVKAIKEGKSTITVTTVDGNKTATCSLVVTKAKQEWSVVTSINDLVDGDLITFGNDNKDVVAGSFVKTDTSGYFTKLTASIKNGAFEEVDGLSSFTVRQNGSYYQFENEDGDLLGATAAKKLTFNGGETNWSISISGGSATITNKTETNGKIMYNSASNAQRFTCYSSKATSSMLLPEIYRGQSADPVYPTEISLSGNTDLYVGDTSTLTVSYIPVETNKKAVTWSSTDTSVATVEKGVVKALKAGTTTITAKAQGESGEISASKVITVSNVAVTSISLNETTKTLSVGKTFTLSATVLPTNATIKDVTWSTSNDKVATVDKGVVKGIAVGEATITATSVDSGKTAQCVVTVQEQVLDSWTIMIYMCGSDLESDNGLAYEDIKEIKSVIGQPDDVNIILETGGATSWSSASGISSEKLQRWHFNNKTLVKDADLTTNDMGTKAAFQSFLEWGLTEYPAENTGVILWNHGGALDGCCYDDNSGDSLTASEVKTALQGAFKTMNRNEKLEWIGYDCCLMQVQDIAEFNSTYFNYMIASEESEAGEGWDYDTWVDDLYAYKSTETILTSICDGFIAEYQRTYGSQGYDNDQTLSWLDLSKMATYKSAFESLASSAKSTIQNDSSSFVSMMKTVKNYADTWCDRDTYNEYVNQYGYPTSWFDRVSEDGQTYYLLHGYYLYGTFDIYDYLTKFASKYSSFASEANQVKEALGELIGHNAAGNEAGESHGLALVCPMTNLFTVYPSNETNFTNWRSVVNNLL